MIKNFFKIALRNLGKNKAFSFINIFGLAIGLTCFMFIAAFVFNELNYDQYPADAKNIYWIHLSVAAPLMMKLTGNFGGLVLKIKTTDVKGFLADLKRQWDSFNPEGPLGYTFLDDNFAKLYASEIRTQQIFSGFALIAIIIASLGLFGLSAFVIEQRTREIGIRKVLGASVQNVLILVSKEFLLLVGIAFIISVPVTWWAMHAWLQDFAYRINISMWVFAIAGIVAILIALLTVSFRAIKAAIANPVKSLRTE